MKTILYCLLVLNYCLAFIKKSHKHKKVVFLSKDQQLDRKGVKVLYGFNKSGKLRRNMIVREEMNVPLLEDCSFMKTSLYPLCLQLQDCNLCMRSSKCGWCENTKKCIPTACDAECLNIQGYPMLLNKCPNENRLLYNGTLIFNNEAQRLVNPEISNPKVRLHFSKDKLATYNTTEQIGTHTLEDKMNLQNVGGFEHISQHKIKTQPQYATTTVNLPYETKVWDEYYDQDTGKQLFRDADVNHGTEVVNKRRRRRRL